MNLPNKLTMTRIFMTFLIIVILLFPFSAMGINVTQLLINETIKVDIRYPIAGVLFILASLTDFIDGYIARSRNLITDFGKMMDAIADKVLVNGLLIILAYDGMISVAIPVIIITRDIFVDSFKMASGKKGKVVAASFTGKAKTMCMMIGMALTCVYNLPFELIGLNIADALLIIATILSVISACQYYYNTKDTFKAK